MVDVETRKAYVERLKKIENGRGIQYILDEAYNIYGNPMLVFDMEYKLIATSKSMINDDPIWNEFMKHGQLSVETIEFCKNEGFIDAVANSGLHKGIAWLISDKLKYKRLFGQLYNKDGVPVADLVALEGRTPFFPDSPHVFKIACDLLTNELSNNTYYQDYGQTYKVNIVNKLLDGSIEDRQLYTGHVANIYNDLRKNVFAVVIGAEDMQPYDCISDLKQLLPQFDYYSYDKRILILMSWDDDCPTACKEELAKLDTFLQEKNIYAGVSSCFDNMFELRNYYDEAVDKLGKGLHTHSSQHLFY